MAANPKMRELTRLLDRQLRLEAEVEAAEEALKEARKKLWRVSREDIPTLMQDELGITKLEMDDGSQVLVKDEMTASISKDRRAAACAQLRKYGLGALVRHSFTVTFGLDEDARADKFRKLLLKNNAEFDEDETANTGSVKAAMKERLANSQPVNLEAFGISVYRETKIKQPKE